MITILTILSLIKYILILLLQNKNLIIILKIIIKFLAIVLPILIAVAFFTLAERKILASIQRRKGPNVVGFMGFLQPFADALKLIIKETVIPGAANKFLYMLGPILMFSLSVSTWSVIPFGEALVFADVDLALLVIFCMSSLSVYGVIISGWSSNSKYAFLGALRSAAQMISYEVSLGLIILSLVLCVGSLNIEDIVIYQEEVWFIIPFFPVFFLFFITALAETNRPPFDLPEAEAELVSGYNVEYSAAGFALFFIAEYANMILMSTLCSLLFLGGWLPIWPFSVGGIFWLVLKQLFFIYMFIWVRAAVPRYRYDQLMRLGWKVILPLSLCFLVFVSSFLYSFNCFPPIDTF
jgi:NADH-quinone oxidoreductase subunit H